MHGIIFAELQRFVERGHDIGAWKKLLRDAGLGDRIYMSFKDYPDGDLFAIVKAASLATGTPESAIIESFGHFIAPDLLKMYAVLVKPDWRTLDVIEHTEAVVHAVVRANRPGARPPELKCTRKGKNEVTMIYDSPRKMCALAKGIIRGLADHYHERIDVYESTCMHTGAPHCTLAILRILSKA